MAMEDIFSSNMDSYINLDGGITDFPWNTSTGDADFDALFQLGPLETPVIDPTLEGFASELLQQPSISNSDNSSPEAYRTSPTQEQQPLPTPQSSKAPEPSPPRESPRSTPYPTRRQRQNSKSSRPCARSCIEHRYRSSISSRFHELRCCIADKDATGGETRDEKLNKSSVLSNAADHIIQLSSAISQQQQRIGALNKHIQNSRMLLEGLCTGESEGIGFGNCGSEQEQQQGGGLANSPTREPECMWIP